MHPDGRKKICRFLYALLALLLPASAGAAPTTAEQAERVVQHWLSLDRRPLEAELGSAVTNVEAYNDQDGQPLYYAVNLSPKGFVIISGDTDVEPIIAFAPEGQYDPSEKKPLGALVSRDLSGRVRSARAAQAAGRSSVPQKAAASGPMSAPQKWDWLGQDIPSNTPVKEAWLPSISDIRVVPLLQSKWSQEGIYNSFGQNISLYNLYTPNNYPSGCVATAMSQVMRYFAYPTAPVGAGTYTVTVDVSPQTTSLRGGNGTGGAYSWSDMPYLPNGNTITSSQQNAIGSLLHDTGASVCMSYTSGGSGSDTLRPSHSFQHIFQYENAVNGINYNKNSNSLDDIPASERDKMTNPNLDAGYPVIYGISGTPGGHAVVCDGYGYNSSTMYHHLNMGWGGASDVWYALPTIDSSLGTFSTIYKSVYNIYTTGAGEIISGRVTDSSGSPLSGVSIIATGGYTALTNDKGIYALKKIPSASTYTINASKAGYTFSPQSVSTGTSADGVNLAENPCAGWMSSGAGTVGNVWGADFTAFPGPEIDIRGNGSSIISGDISPSKSDHTDFGATPISTQVSRTYTIANTGSAPLMLSTPTLSGGDCDNFIITEWPAFTVAAGSTTTFTIRYLPSFSGASNTCTVSVASSDSDENIYTFTIKGAEGIEMPGWLPAVYDLLM